MMYIELNDDDDDGDDDDDDDGDDDDGDDDGDAGDKIRDGGEVRKKFHLWTNGFSPLLKNPLYPLNWREVLTRI